MERGKRLCQGCERYFEIYIEVFKQKKRTVQMCWLKWTKFQNLGSKWVEVGSKMGQYVIEKEVKRNLMFPMPKIIQNVKIKL